ncbi:hypothetical protein NMG60_11023904 [Bertholletia excelsa]
MGETDRGGFLDLGLSLGGCFSGSSPKLNKPIIRTCSAGVEEREGGFLSLARSASLPTEVEQETRRVREMQAFKRMEVRTRLKRLKDLESASPNTVVHGGAAAICSVPESGKRVYQQAQQETPQKRVKMLGNGIIGDLGMIEMRRNMPSVTTTGDGPNGKKIEGFLYGYKKGQVSVVCVCHGNLFSPAEFVRHAGGTDVANPMRRIHVLLSTL